MNDDLAMRALATFSWFRRNSVALKRETLDNLNNGVLKLEEIGREPFIDWAGPRIKEEICSEDLPETSRLCGIGHADGHRY